MSTQTEQITCEWYALCRNQTDRYASHPILGPVPVCERCAGKHEMTTRPLSDLLP